MNELIVQKSYKIISNCKIRPIGKSSDPKGAIVDLGPDAEFVFEPPKQYLQIRSGIFGRMKAALVDGFALGTLKGYKAEYNAIHIESPDGITFIVKR